MKGRDLSLVLMVVVIWGINFLFVKIGTEEIPPLLLTALRFMVVALAVVPFRPRLPQPPMTMLAFALVLGVGHFGLFFAGVARIGAAGTAIILQLSVPFSAIMAACLYRERLGKVEWLGMALAMAGIAVIQGSPVPPDALGSVLILFSAFFWALSNIMVKGMGPVDSLALNGWMALIAVPLLLVISFVLEHGQVQSLQQAGWKGWSGVFYTALASSVLSYTIWYRLISRLPVSRVVPFNLLPPVIAIAGGGLILSEPMGWRDLLGGALTILGVAVIQLRPLFAKKPT